LFVSSLLFLELHCEIEFGCVSLHATEQNLARRSAYHATLRQIYRNLDEPDSLHGIPSGDDTWSSILLYEHEGRWDQALSAYDRLLAFGQSSIALKAGLLRALGKVGLMHMWSGYLSGVGATNLDEFSELSEFQSELAWRTCRWDDSDSKLVALAASRSGRVQLHQAALQCLRGLHGSDKAVFQSALDAMRLGLLSDLSVSTLENTKSAGPTLSRLRFFREIESCWSVCVAAGADTKRRVVLLADLDREWGERNLVMHRARDYTAFEEIESILSIRVSLSSALGAIELMPRHLLTLTSVARKCGRINIALGALHRLKQLQPDSLTGPFSIVNVLLKLFFRVFFFLKKKKKKKKKKGSLGSRRSRCCNFAGKGADQSACELQHCGAARSDIVAWESAACLREMADSDWKRECVHNSCFIFEAVASKTSLSHCSKRGVCQSELHAGKTC
jgi:hypothetical protein